MLVLMIPEYTVVASKDWPAVFIALSFLAKTDLGCRPCAVVVDCLLTKGCRRPIGDIDGAVEPIVVSMLGIPLILMLGRGGPFF